MSVDGPLELRARVRGAARCPYCHDGVRAETGRPCLDCGALHHRECWTELGGCSACSFGPRSSEPTAPEDPVGASPGRLSATSARRRVFARERTQRRVRARLRASALVVLGGLVLAALGAFTAVLVAPGSVDPSTFTVGGVLTALLGLAATALGAWKVVDDLRELAALRLLLAVDAHEAESEGARDPKAGGSS